MNKLLELIRRKRWAYIRTFLGAGQQLHPEAVIVMRDLKRYCGINRGGIVVSPISRMVDSHATAYRAGQRDVYLRIAKFLSLDEDDNPQENDHARTSTGE